MIVSHSRSFVFVHVPKCAGDAISAALAPHCTAADVVETDGRTSGPLKHATAKEIRRLYFGDGRWSSYLKFGVIRNPWDQVHSDWWYCRTHDVEGDPGIDRQWAAKCRRARERTFAEFVREETHDNGGLWRYYLSDGERPLVDVVLRYENLADEWPRLLRRLGLPPTTLEQRNVTARRPAYADDYDEATREMVGRRFAGDVRRFGYG